MALRATPYRGHTVGPGPRKRGLRAKLVRVVVRARRAQRRLLPGRRPAPPRVLAAPPAAVGPDPVQLVVLAIERLAPASFRSATLGHPVEVAVPDDATAAVFRAALARTCPNRSTDRLLSIVVEAGR
jgi:hypothetical protein